MDAELQKVIDNAKATVTYLETKKNVNTQEMADFLQAHIALLYNHINTLTERVV